MPDTTNQTPGREATKRELLAENAATGNQGIDYSGHSHYSDCVGQKLESFKCADVKNGYKFASHVLLSHPNFSNRPTCLVLYTTW